MTSLGCRELKWNYKATMIVCYVALVQLPLFSAEAHSKVKCWRESISSRLQERDYLSCWLGSQIFSRAAKSSLKSCSALPALQIKKNMHALHSGEWCFWIQTNRPTGWVSLVSAPDLPQRSADPVYTWSLWSLPLWVNKSHPPSCADGSWHLMTSKSNKLVNDRVNTRWTLITAMHN